MKLTTTEEIFIAPDRIRRFTDPEKLVELRESIKTVGLLHLPVLRKTEKGFVLAAGYRRLCAMQTLHEQGEVFSYMHEKIPPGKIPFALFEELDNLLAIEVELQENIARQDISWQERAEATARLHSLRLSQDASHTVGETAEELHLPDGNQTSIKKRLILAEHLDDKDIASAPSEKEGLRRLSKKLEQDFNAALFGTQESAGIDVRCIDALEGMKSLPAESVHVIITDPPYGINAQKFAGGRRDKTSGVYVEGQQHDYDDDPEVIDGLMLVFAHESYRTAAKEAHLYMFCDLLRFPTLALLFRQNGWYVWSHPYIWYKDVGHFPNGNLGPRRMYECILYAIKGQRAINKMIHDVIICPTEPERLHAAQKPVALYQTFLEVSAVPGDTVLDPFCGSGPIFVAARNLKLHAIGFDSDPNAVATAKLRFSK